MEIIKNFFAVFIVLLLATACVSKSKHLQMVDGYKAELKLMDDRLVDQQKQLAIALQDKDKLKLDLNQLAEYKSNAETRIQEYKKLTSKFSDLINSGKLKVNMVEGRMVVVMSTDILFKSGSATLSTEGAKEIEQVSLVLKDLENKQFQIAGHTDNVPIKSTYKTNWNLAADRAYSVLVTMLKSGFPRERVSISSYAETKPAAGNDDSVGRELNRRIEIIVVPDLSLLPGQGEIEKLFTN